MAEGKLESTHQVFIVQQFAMFERAKEIQSLLKQNFGVEISLQGICYYDPETNSDLPKKLKALFKSTRARFLKNSNSIPIANKSYRLQKLWKMFEQEENNDPKVQNKKAMREILEQAAKESGDSFSNKQKHELTGKDGGPIKTETKTDLSKLSTEELIQLQEIQNKLKNG